jgi:hypothetical protein
MPTRRREEVLNVLLAQSICDTGLTADPENILKRVKGGRQMPDVLVYLQGLRCSIDGKYEDNPNFREELEYQAASRRHYVGEPVCAPPWRLVSELLAILTRGAFECFEFFFEGFLANTNVRTTLQEVFNWPLTLHPPFPMADGTLGPSVKPCRFGKVSAACSTYRLALHAGSHPNFLEPRGRTFGDFPLQTTKFQIQEST